MKAVVLSGGGSLGSYQIGVWKALRRLHYHYDIVTGTSIGALNGAMMVQNDYRKVLKLWKSINMNTLFGDQKNFTRNRDILWEFKNEFFKNGGMDVTNIEEIIREYVNIKKFYRSKIQYGLVTVNLKKKKPLLLTKGEISKQRLTDYLMASASCYPAFQPKKIDEEKYIDGGYYDNIPVNLAIQLGATEAVVVDLNTIGFKHKPKENIDIIMIKPNNKLSFFLNFSKESAKRNMIFGYNDTMKKFHRYEGYRYTFRKNTAKKCYDRYYPHYEKVLEEVLHPKKMPTKLLKNSLYKKKTQKSFLLLMESMGTLFALDEAKVYRYQTYHQKLFSNMKKEIKKTSNHERTNMVRSQIIKFYQDLKKGKRASLGKKALLFPQEFSKALYLYVISKN